VGDTYWPAGISPDPVQIQEDSEPRPTAAASGDQPKPSVAEGPAQQVPDMGKQVGGTAVAGGTWGEAGGFPRVPKRQGEVTPRGPVWLDALKDPISIVMAVALAGLMGGFGAYLGWRMAAQQEAARLQRDADNKVSAARAEFEVRQKALETDLEGARSRLADVERANAAMEKQGKEGTKAVAEAKGALAALQQKFDALQKTQAQNEERAQSVADLLALRGEQARLVGSLQEVVGDVGEVGTDGPYVFVRLKTRLYAENSSRPAEAVVAAVKKVAAFAKAYEGPYRLHAEGHTDANPGPTAAGEGSNLHTGAMRALDIARVLVDAGVAPSRVALLSQGEAFPLRASKTDDSVGINRRVELVFAPSRTIAPVAVEEPAPPVTTAEIPKAVPVAPTAVPAIPVAPAAVPAAAPATVAPAPTTTVAPAPTTTVAPAPTTTVAPAPATTVAPAPATVAPAVPVATPRAREPVPVAPAVIKSGTPRERVKPASGR